MKIPMVGSQCNRDGEVEAQNAARHDRLKKKRENKKRNLAVTMRYSNPSQEERELEGDRKETRKMMNRAAAQRARDKAKKNLEEITLELALLRKENELLKKSLVDTCTQSPESPSVKRQNEPVDAIVNQEQEMCVPGFQFQRMPNFSFYRFPFMFAILALLACLLLLAVGPQQTSIESELRFLEGSVPTNKSQKKLRREPPALRSTKRLVDPTSATIVDQLKQISKSSGSPTSQVNSIDQPIISEELSQVKAIRTSGLQ